VLRRCRHIRACDGRHVSLVAFRPVLREHAVIHVPLDSQIVNNRLPSVFAFLLAHFLSLIALMYSCTHSRLDWIDHLVVEANTCWRSTRRTTPNEDQHYLCAIAHLNCATAATGHPYPIERYSPKTETIVSQIDNRNLVVVVYC
jgi:hypothetical protein